MCRGELFGTLSSPVGGILEVFLPFVMSIECLSSAVTSLEASRFSAGRIVDVLFNRISNIIVSL